MIATKAGLRVGAARVNAGREIRRLPAVQGSNLFWVARILWSGRDQRSRLPDRILLQTTFAGTDRYCRGWHTDSLGAR
jgi:hypothetical protein